MSRLSFAQRIVNWQRLHGRHHLPWQNTRDAYRIWLSEIMLQQTQVETVINYYQRFLRSFPNIRTLAKAPLSRVLEHWSGLGYYRRAHHLHAAAREVMNRYGGKFPETQEMLMALPGIGRSTAAAIAVFAFDQRAAILDGNVKRVLARHRAIEGNPSLSAIEKTMWAVAETLLPKRNLSEYTQGLMDLGASICTRRQPDCAHCPLRRDCVARLEQRTHLLPTPKTAQPLVELRFHILILKRKQRILLEERVTQKIWTGLWSFPECALTDDVAQVVKRRYGLTAAAIETFPVMTHRLTHRRLIMTPVEVDVRGRLRTTASCRFLSREEVLRDAIPTPVRSIILARI
ncbi:MAG: A/G-specific adenine glycosylase [Burkholderiales bacterium]|jgi:A/G-specific adenine glycosylase|nr:A/G-specific adenine glycosylase [Burkholderiales bacterium]